MGLLGALTQSLTLCEQVASFLNKSASFTSTLNSVKAFDVGEFFQLACLLVAEHHVGEVILNSALVQHRSKVPFFILDARVFQSQLELQACVRALGDQLLLPLIVIVRQLDVAIAKAQLLLDLRHFVLERVFTVGE